MKKVATEEVVKISYKDLKRIWRRLPIAERKMPIAIVDKKVFTWDQCLKELKKGSALAEKIQQKLGEI